MKQFKIFLILSLLANGVFSHSMGQQSYFTYYADKVPARVQSSSSSSATSNPHQTMQEVRNQSKAFRALLIKSKGAHHDTHAQAARDNVRARIAWCMQWQREGNADFIKNEIDELSQDLKKIEHLDKTWEPTRQIISKAIDQAKKIYDSPLTQYFQKISSGTFKEALHACNAIETEYTLRVQTSLAPGEQPRVFGFETDIANTIPACARKLLESRPDYKTELSALSTKHPKVQNAIDTLDAVSASFCDVSSKQELAKKLSESSHFITTQYEKLSRDVPTDLQNAFNHYSESLLEATSIQDYYLNLGGLAQVTQYTCNDLRQKQGQPDTQYAAKLLQGGKECVRLFNEFNEIAEDQLTAYYNAGKFLADVCIGHAYLDENAYQQRMEQFWNYLSTASFKDISRDAVIDTIKKTIVTGIYVYTAVNKSPYVIIRFISRINDIIRLGQSLSNFAQQLKDSLGGLLAEHPVVATSTGATYWTLVEEAPGLTWGEWARSWVQDVKPIELTNPDDLLFNFQENSGWEKHVRKQVEEKAFSSKIEPSLEQILKSEERNTIKELRTGFIKQNHIFSDDHVKGGIMQLGKDQENIVFKIFEKVMQADRQGKVLNNATTRFATEINGIEVEFGTHVIDGKLYSVDCYVGKSSRIQPIRV